MARALLVDDDDSHREALKAFLESEGFGVREADCLEQTRRALAEEEFDLLLSDLQLPDGSALDLGAELEERPGMDVVLVTGYATVETAVEAFRGGAIDYLTKPVDVARLRHILQGVRRSAGLRGQVAELRTQLRQLGRFGRLIGASPAMQVVYDQILKVAARDTTVFLTGESGTGKELVALTLHELGPRAAGPFQALNCAAVSPQLVESELFGHERGSFTGAVSRHAGFFERADGGTLLLDEITEMPAELQVKLLRALESREVHRIGGDHPIRVDVRVLAASNRDPKKAAAEGRLREDLLYRLLVFPIQLPPLRAREGDVDLLATHFLADLNRREGTRKELTQAARERLRLHAWPGNVRELRNAIERAFIVAPGDLGVECLSLGGRPEGAGDGALEIHVGMSSAEAERILTLATLDRYREKKRTAEVLGISLKTLYNRLQGYQGEPPGDPGQSGSRAPREAERG